MLRSQWLRSLGTTVVALVALAVGSSVASEPAGVAATKPAKPRRVLYLTHSAGFNHDVLGLSEEILAGLGVKTGAFKATCLEGYKQKPNKIDLSMISPEYLKQFDAIIFYTTGKLPLKDEQKKAIIEFVKGGKGFVGIHSATDYCPDADYWPDFVDMLGPRFKTHGANDAPVYIKNHDPKFPATKMLPEDWKIADELYQFIEPVPRDKFRILLTVDTARTDEENLKKNKMEKGKTYEISWCRDYGKGRVFYTSLGHNDAVWKDKLYQEHLVAGIQWAIGDLPGDATPSAKKAEEAAEPSVRPRARMQLTRSLVGASGPIALAIDLYRTHMGAYPENLKDLTEKPAGEEKAKKWKGPYISDPAALKDAWGRELQYKAPGEHKPDSYDLWSVGRDGENGTSDDIGNWQPAGRARRAR